MSAYSDLVLSDAPTAYWRLGDGPGPNIVNDPSFESGSLGVLQNSWALGDPTEFSIDTSTDGFLSGAASLKATTTRTGTNWNACIYKTNLTIGGISHVFTVTPGQQYFMSNWSKQTAGALNTHYKVTWLDSVGNGLSLNAPMGGASGVMPWTFYSGTVTAPAGAAYAQVAVMFGSWDGVTGSNAQIWFDDIQFSPITVAGLATANVSWLNYRNTVLLDRPIAYWRLDDIATKAYDETRNGRTGTIVGGITTRRSGFQTNAQSWGMLFDGTTGYISGDTTLLNNLTDLTLECWVFPTDLSADHTLISKELVVKYRIDATAAPYVLVSTNGTSWDQFLGQIGPNNTITLNAWNHVVCTINKKTITAYVNGKSVGTATMPNGAGGSTVAPFAIGSYNTGVGEFLKGVLDEAAVYDYALSSGQVLAHYSAGTMASANGTILGFTTTGQAPATNDGDKAMLFDGVGATIDTNLVMAGAPFSAECWFKAAAFNYAFPRLISTNTFQAPSGWVLNLVSSGGVYNGVFFGLMKGVSNTVGITAGFSDPTAWHHVVVTYDGASMTLYLNGVSAGTVPGPAGWGQSTNHLFLGSTLGVSEFYPGYLDDTVVYGYALSPSQVMTHYNAGLAAWVQPSGTVNQKTSMTTLPVNLDVATTETKPYQINVGSYLSSNDGIRSVSATLLKIPTGQVVTDAWQGTLSVSGNVITLPINCGVLTKGTQYQVIVTFTANFNKIMTFYTFLNVVA